MPLCGVRSHMVEAGEKRRRDGGEGDRRGVRGVCIPITTEQRWGRGTFPALCFGAGVQVVVDGSLGGLKDGLRVVR